MNWKDEINWGCPTHFDYSIHATYKSGGLVFAQVGFQRPFWPLLFPDGYNPIRAVMDMCEIHGAKEWYFLAEGERSLLTILAEGNGGKSKC